MKREDGPDQLTEALAILTIPEVGEKLGAPGLKVGLQKSPFREDDKPSFSIFKQGRMFKDQASGETGGVWTFAAKCLGTTDKKAIADAIKHCAGIVDDGVIRRSVVARPAPKAAMFEHSPAWPLGVMDRFRAGVAGLEADKEATAKLAGKRGWPTSFVERLTEGQLISYPPLPWCDDKDAGSGARYQRGVAFVVQAPVMRGTVVDMVPVGYHQMFKVEDRRQWVYVPYVPQKTRSGFQEELARQEKTIHPYPFAVGDANSDAWVISEGQWDISTFVLAAGARFSGFGLGLRGSHTTDLFFQVYGAIIATVKPIVWLVPDNDAAGMRWLERDPKKPDQPSFVERLHAAGARQVWVSKIRPEIDTDENGQPRPRKDFNDLYRAREICEDAMLSWAASVGLDGAFFRNPPAPRPVVSVDRNAEASAPAPSPAPLSSPRPPVEWALDAPTTKVLGEDTVAPPAAKQEGDVDTAVETPAEWYYHDDAKTYWAATKDGGWVELNQKLFDLHLRSHGFSKREKHEDSDLSQVEAEVLRTVHEQRVSYAGPLAGWKVGVVRFADSRALITKSPVLPQPKRPEHLQTEECFPVLAGFFFSLLVGQEPDGSWVDQRAHFFCWLQHAMRSLYAGVPTRGLCLAIAGEPKSGKTLIKDLVRHMFGGRECLPYDFMIGKDNFNLELSEAPLWSIDDEAASTKAADRAAFGAQIKKVVANSAIKIRGIQKDGIVLNPFRRLMICLNNEPDCIMVLPPMDDHIVDKMLILKGYKGTYPMPTGTVELERKFWDAMMAEIPNFLWWLLNVWNDPVTGCGRFGCQHWAHPEILNELMDVSKDKAVLDMLDVWMKHKGEFCWTGTTSELRNQLCGDDSGLGYHDKQEVPKPAWLGKTLTKLARKHSKRFVHNRTATANTWTIYRAGYEGKSGGMEA